MLITLAEWKAKASLLDNQWHQFQSTQPHSFFPKAISISCPPNFQPPPFHPSSLAPSTTGPQPMDLDCDHQTGRDPFQGVCFNCGKPGHMARSCQEPRTQRVQNVEPSPTSSLASRLSLGDLQMLVETIQAMMTPMEPSPMESTGSNPPEQEDF